MIIYACPDLLFASKIRSTADALQLVSRPARDEGMLQKRLDQVEDGKPNGPVGLVVIDLGLEDAGLAMIEQVRRHDAALPIVAYGSHVLTDLLEQAKQRGATLVTTNGNFTRNLEAILQEYV